MQVGLAEPSIGEHMHLSPGGATRPGSVEGLQTTVNNTRAGGASLQANTTLNPAPIDPATTYPIDIGTTGTFGIEHGPRALLPEDMVSKGGHELLQARI
jgi:hypothetical protein